MEYRRFDQSETFLCNCFKSGTMDQMLRKELYFSSGGKVNKMISRAETIGQF